MGIQRYYIKKKIHLIALFLCIIAILFSFLSFFKLPSEVIFLNVLSNSLSSLKLVDNDKRGEISLKASYDTGFIKTAKKKSINPLSIISFSFSGFSSMGLDDKLLGIGRREDNLQDIECFSDVPEGDIYFSEEDEYKSEELKNMIEGQSLAPISPKGIVEEEFLMGASSPNKIALTGKTPEILIYHSHATESYMPSTEGNYHTLNDKYNVLSIGKNLARVLEDKYKYKVIHDKTYHDKDSYAYSYSNSLETIKQQSAKNKSIKVLLDIHRDAFTVKDEEHRRQKKNEYSLVVNGRTAARIMLVISEANPNYKELEKFAAYIKKKMDKLYPGLYLRTDKKTRSKYNQFTSDYSCLIEVGCMLNTIDEANYSAELLGNVIGEVLKDLQK